MRFRQPLDKIGSAEIRTMLDANLVAAFMLSKRSASLMTKGNYGRIINISSVASERARAGDAAYIVTKGALNSLTRALAAEFGRYGITCNAIVPGTFRTETNEEILKAESMQQWFQSRVLLRRVGEPWEIGGAALFLASPAAGYVTGISLPVDGGYLVAG
jgi:gluconate 5-dehydrogenase